MACWNVYCFCSTMAIQVLAILFALPWIGAFALLVIAISTQAGCDQCCECGEGTFASLKFINIFRYPCLSRFISIFPPIHLSTGLTNLHASICISMFVWKNLSLCLYLHICLHAFIEYLHVYISVYYMNTNISVWHVLFHVTGSCLCDDCGCMDCLDCCACC